MSKANKLLLVFFVVLLLIIIGEVGYYVYLYAKPDKPRSIVLNSKDQNMITSVPSITQSEKKGYERLLSKVDIGYLQSLSKVTSKNHKIYLLQETSGIVEVIDRDELQKYFHYTLVDENGEKLEDNYIYDDFLKKVLIYKLVNNQKVNILFNEIKAGDKLIHKWQKNLITSEIEEDEIQVIKL